MAERAHPPFLNYQPEISSAGGWWAQPGWPRGRTERGEGGSCRAGLRAVRYGTVRYGTEGRPSLRRAALPARTSRHRRYRRCRNRRRGTAGSPERQPLGARRDPLSPVPASPAGLFPSADPQPFSAFWQGDSGDVSLSRWQPKSRGACSYQSLQGRPIYFAESGVPISKMSIRVSRTWAP